MKRISFAALTTALVLLSGCNKENDNLGSNENLFIESETDVRFIKLGGKVATTVSTRASVESLDEVGQMGVFCLAARKTDVKNAEEAKDIDWRQIVASPDESESYGTTTNGIYWPNILCDVINNGSGYAIEPVTNATYYGYYPVSSWFGYDFYGYYPYQAEGFWSTSDSVLVDMTINGTQDVIWGKSETPDIAALTNDIELQEKLGKCYYSARYFRNHPNEIDDVHMKFDHLLTRFRFHVYPGANSENAADKKYSEAASLCIKEIRLNQVEDNLRLVVADRSGNNREGKLYSYDENTTSFYLHHKDGARLSDRPVNIPTQTDSLGVVTPDTTVVGDCIMVLPERSAYYMSVVLADTANHDKTYSSERNITIALNAAQSRKFEAGKTYNVYLRVTGVTMIGITAELERWEESEEELDFIEFN